MTLREERPDYDLRIWYSQDIAQFRYEQGKWTVWSMNRDNEWSKVVSIQPESDFERQLELVELDQEGVFWVS
ncbi:DUF3024 domain-containing protein [Bacillus horti]|uniref:DUF3024 domain-containing protein n=1 Tax=Caldalkalibacillus horti TaxID=77523 RepID=A0ABT9VWD6_9BACI|nr:DUF3024 domain-containing protein [Bacillus horti]MDQ0165310.1 hypothetical protein [Bacillus horti]